LVKKPSEEFGEYPTKKDTEEAFVHGRWMAAQRQACLPGIRRGGPCAYETFASIGAVGFIQPYR
jgi:hypothetical protein